MKKDKPVSKIYSEALQQIIKNFKRLESVTIISKPERYPGDADFQNKFGVYGSRIREDRDWN